MGPAAEIRRRGWRQCSIASDSLRKQLEREELLGDTTADDLLIIATQDCDLVHPSFETEPYVELLVGKPLSTSDGNCLRGKNPRRLHIDVTTASGPAPFEILAVSRFSISREILSEHNPDSLRTADDVAQAVIPQWLAKRYVRAALPDAFNVRVATVQSKVRDRLKTDGRLVEAIYLMIDPEDELGSGQEYRVLVTVVAREEVFLQEGHAKRLERLAARMTELFKKAKGIKLLEDCVVVADAHFSLADVSRSIEWDVYDDLSFGDLDQESV